MLRNAARRPNDNVARAQLLMLARLGDALHLSPDDCRRALDLSDPEWQAWRDFRDCRHPLPARPALPDMLRRVARVSFNLGIVAEIGGTPAGSRTATGSLHGCATNEVTDESNLCADQVRDGAGLPGRS